MSPSDLKYRLKVRQVDRWVWSVEALHSGSPKLTSHNWQELDLTDRGAAALRIAERLDRFDDELAGQPEPERAEFWRIFADTTLMTEDGSARMIRFEGNTEDERALQAAAVFYHGLYLFLITGNRYENLSAYLALLFSAWQWYNALKRLPVAANSPEWLKWSNDLAEAYYTLTDLLDDPRFSFAAHWLGHWRRDNAPSRPLMGERLRLSLVLSEENEEMESGLSVPLKAPGCLKQGKLEWSAVSLHRAYVENASGKATVRRLVSDWLLPRDKFDTSIRLAWLLKNHSPTKWGPWLLLTGALAFFLVIIFIFSFSNMTLSLGWKVALIWVFGGLSLLFIINFYDFGLLPTLVLPRIMGGMLLGYAALILEGTTVAQGIWSLLNGWGLKLLWTIVLAIAFFYLYNDIWPLVLHGGTSFLRAFGVLLLILLAAFLIGLPAVAISTAAYGETICPCSGQFLIGPLGEAQLCQMLAFMPLAILIGLITQFIWEERTATSPVWPPEEK